MEPSRRASSRNLGSRDVAWAPSRTAAIVVCALVGLALGCGPQFKDNVYRDGSLAFRVGVLPAGWHRVEIEGSRLAFRDASDQATIGIEARCGSDAPDLSLDTLTRHLFLSFTDTQILSQRKLTLDGRGALRTELTASLDGVPRHLVAFVVQRNRCVYDFLNVNPAPLDDAGRESVVAFDHFVAGFAAIEQ